MAAQGQELPSCRHRASIAQTATERLFSGVYSDPTIYTRHTLAKPINEPL